MASPHYVTLSEYAAMVGVSRQALRKRIGKDIQRAKEAPTVILIDINEYPPEDFKKQPGKRNDLPGKLTIL